MHSVTLRVKRCAQLLYAMWLTRCAAGSNSGSCSLFEHKLIALLTAVLVTDMKGKEYVMKLMHHPDADVQKQALLCVQKLMLAKDKLQFLGIEVAAGDF